MTIYLVDCENVHNDGLAGIERLTGTDQVVLFYGKQQNSIALSVVKILLSSSCPIDLLQMKETGKNFLDMQLAIHMGILMKTYPEAEFVIISKDKGFDSLLLYAKDCGRIASRRSVIDEM